MNPFDLFTRTAAAGSRDTASYRTSSAMGTVGVYCGSAAALCFSAAFGLKDQTVYSGVMVACGCLCVMVGLGIAVYFAIFDPDRCQSERFVIQQQVLEITQAKGMKFPVAPVNLQAIADPHPARQERPAIGGPSEPSEEEAGNE